MFSVNLTGAGVGSPASVAVTISANDSTPLGVPTISLTGRLLMMLATALAGLWALVRRGGASAILLGALMLAAFSVAPDLSAAPARNGGATTKGSNEQKSKIKGTLLSISNDGTNLQLSLSGGITLTLPQKVVSVVDQRSATAAPSSVAQLVSNMYVMVKVHLDKSGKVTEAKIKILG